MRGPIRWPERAAARGQEEHADRDRQGGDAGLEGAVAADGLELEDQEEQHGAEGGVDEQRHRVGGAEGAVAEEPERHHRVADRDVLGRQETPRP